MKRWGIAIIAAILSCIPVILHRASSAALLADSDTAFLLRTIRAKQAPFFWFTSDWPLGNHFYRPVSTLAFELDNRLYGDNAAGYGLTNALLCCACILLLAWMVREITDSVALTSGATAVFGIWHWNGFDFLLHWLAWGSVAIGLLGLFRHGFKVSKWLPAVGAVSFLAYEGSGLMPLHFRMIDWLPGRTASVMTVFCLIAGAAYARYERTSATRDLPKATSTDEPATKSSVEGQAPARSAWIWALVAMVSGALALASYEQAVMLPTILFGIAFSFHLRNYRVRWAWQVGFWLLLAGYYFIRKAYIPPGASDYQLQQFRHGPGVFLSLTAYLAPCISGLMNLAKTLDIGPFIVMTPTFWGAINETFANVSSFFAWRKHWILALVGYALSFFAYLPMAWLNQFDHYHYWPMAFRSIYVAVLAWGTWELCVIAVSPPKQQAPRRLSPAPGSLPRR
jgi:hypothetical protein